MEGWSFLASNWRNGLSMTFKMEDRVKVSVALESGSISAVGSLSKNLYGNIVDERMQRLMLGDIRIFKTLV